MALTPILVELPTNYSGLLLKLFRISPTDGDANPVNDDTFDNVSGPDVLTEYTNREGLYVTQVDEALTDWHYAVIETAGGAGVATGWVYLTDTEAYHYIQFDVPSTGSSSGITCPTDGTGGAGEFYNVVRRNSDDTRPLYFEWPTSGASLTMTRTINGQPYQAVAGTVTEVQSAGSVYIYSLAYNSNDRPADGVVQYAITDGSVTRFLPLSIDSSSGTPTLRGGSEVTVIVNDGTDPVENCYVTLKRTGERGTKLTDSAGMAVFAVSDGTYTILATAPGFEGAVDSVEVSGDRSKVVTMVATVIPTPSQPELCVVACYVQLNGQPVENAVVRATLVNSNSAIDGILLSNSKDIAETDIHGYAQLELVRQDQFVDGDGQYLIEVFDGNNKLWSLTTSIPNTGAVNLEDLV